MRLVLWAWAFTLVVILLVVVALRLAGWNLVVVSSPSMAPSIPRDSLAITSPVDAKDVEVGDVIEFRDQTQLLILHRVVEVIDVDGVRRFRTKGDRNGDADPGLANEADLRRRLRWSVAGVGPVVDQLRFPRGLLWLALVALPAASLSHLAARRERGSPRHAKRARTL